MEKVCSMSKTVRSFMQASGARYHMRIEINFLDSFAISILYLRDYKHILFWEERGYHIKK